MGIKVNSLKKFGQMGNMCPRRNSNKIHHGKEEDSIKSVSIHEIPSFGNLTSPRADPEKNNNIEPAGKVPPNLPVNSASQPVNDNNYVFTEENDKTSDHILINEKAREDQNQGDIGQKGDGD